MNGERHMVKQARCTASAFCQRKYHHFKLQTYLEHNTEARGARVEISRDLGVGSHVVDRCYTDNHDLEDTVGGEVDEGGDVDTIETNDEI